MSGKASFISSLKKGLFFAVLTGMLFGLSGVVARLTMGGWELFEFYQIILVETLLVAIPFAAFVLFISILKFDNKVLDRLYPATGLCLWLLFITIVSLKSFAYPHVGFLQAPLSLMVIAAFIAVFGIWLWFMNNNLLVFKRNGGFDRLVKNIMFSIVIFVIIYLVYDASTFNSAVSGSDIQGSSLDSPNIILITLDTLRADHLSFHGYEKPTSPFLDSLASESAIFSHAYSTTSWTLPSHASMFTGKAISNHDARIGNQYLSQDHITLAEMLRDEGYITAAFIAGPYLKRKYGLLQGTDVVKDRLDFFEYYLIQNKFTIKYYLDNLAGVNIMFSQRFLGADGERTAEQLNQDAFSFLDQNTDSSFYLFLNYFDVHSPYNLGEEYVHLFTDDEMDYIHDLERVYVDDRIVEYHKALYDAEILYLDNHLKALFQKLEELDLLDDTLIIITSDHGEEFMEHLHFYHAKTLYEESIHVPLMIHHPSINKGWVDVTVSNQDIFSTILDFLDLDEPSGIDSMSLLPLIQDSKSQTGTEHSAKLRAPVLSELYGRPVYGEPEIQQALSDGTWKLIQMTDNEGYESSLFNLEQDPGEQSNLYQDLPAKRGELITYLHQINQGFLPVSSRIFFP